ncbi:MAG: phasin [Ancalomicrobiaceae bacterium]|nr:phasin [Ancalomicrobiaceae bacterium]
MSDATPETVTSAPKKTAKAAPAAEKIEVKFELPKFELPKFEFPKFEVPTAEVPAAFREIAEKSVAQAQAGYAKLKAAAEETNDMIEDTYETARAGTLEFNAKALDAVKANTDAAFGFAKDLIGAKTLSEVIELQTAFARKSFETFSAQAKDLQATAQKVATETAGPVKAATEKALKDFKVA